MQPGFLPSGHQPSPALVDPRPHPRGRARRRRDLDARRRVHALARPRVDLAPRELRGRRAARRGVPRDAAARARGGRCGARDARDARRAPRLLPAREARAVAPQPRARGARRRGRRERARPRDARARPRARPGPLGPHDPDRQQRAQLLRRHRDRGVVPRRPGARTGRDARDRLARGAAAGRRLRRAPALRLHEAACVRAQRRGRGRDARRRAGRLLRAGRHAAGAADRAGDRRGEPALRRRRGPDPEPAPAARAARDREAVTADRGRYRRHRRRPRAAGAQTAIRPRKRPCAPSR